MAAAPGPLGEALALGVLTAERDVDADADGDAEPDALAVAVALTVTAGLSVGEPAPNASAEGVPVAWFEQPEHTVIAAIPAMSTAMAARGRRAFVRVVTGQP